MNLEFDEAKERFEAYVRETEGRLEPGVDPHPISLKLEHSLQVLENAMEILDGMQTEGKIRDLTLLVALFHDVGRFHQYLTYKTFLDSVSLNHGVLGSKILGTTDLLQGLSPEERQMMRASVCLHNRKILPTHISPMLRFMTRVVRDADKIDIIRVMLEHFSAPEGHPVVVLHVKNEPDSFTDSVYEDVWHARRGDYRKLKFVNDFKLMLCGWVHDLNFAPSRNILIRRGLLEQMLETLPDLEPMRLLATRLREILELDMHAKGREVVPRCTI